MAETVLVTTHDLPLAGKLRRGFRHQGYRVELFTATEEVGEVDDVELLTLTGGVDTESGRRHIEQARQRDIPVFAVIQTGQDASAVMDGVAFGIKLSAEPWPAARWRRSAFSSPAACPKAP